MRVATNSTSHTRRFLGVLLRMLAGIMLLLVAYAAAALVGTVWTSGAPRAAAAGDRITVYVLSNGFHSDIALPVDAQRPTGGLPIRATDLPNGLDGVRYLIVGWGSQTAYTSLLALSDLTMGIAVKSLLFDRSVMHVLPYGGDFAGGGAYRLDLSTAEYDRLIAFIDRTFAVDAAGNAELLTGITQGFGDVFYRARPRFSLFYGCNAWTGQAMRKAGVPFGIWTPFAQSVEWNMERIAVR